MLPDHPEKRSNRMNGVSVKKIVEKMKLKVLNPEVDIKNRKVTTAEVNRHCS